MDNCINFTEKNIPATGRIIIIYSDQSTDSTSSNLQWSKSLKEMPTFTIKEIEQHRQLSGKVKGLPYVKTLLGGRRFKEERYPTSDSIFTLACKNYFKVKCKCKASMKKDMRNVEIVINRTTGTVVRGVCSCPAGQSGCCNHVMALLLELADYSIKGFKAVPTEVTCTSTARQWGIPGDKELPKAPVMNTIIKTTTNEIGINSTLYDPRINHDNSYFKEVVDVFQRKLASDDKRIGYAHCIPNNGFSYIDTKFGLFPLGSPLSFHLQPIEGSFELLTNISTGSDKIKKQTKDMCDLPFKILQNEDLLNSCDWTFSCVETVYEKTSNY